MKFCVNIPIKTEVIKTPEGAICRAEYLIPEAYLQSITSDQLRRFTEEIAQTLDSMRTWFDKDTK